MTPVYLPSQHASLHDLPDDPDTLRTVLADAVTKAIVGQRPDGNLEDPSADDDIGDMTLGVVSLFCLAWHRDDRRDAELVGAARRGVDFFLAHRVFRTDNPGEPFLRVRDSGLPYVRYLPAAGEHPFGDWPSTVWALLHAVNVLDLGRALLTDQQYAELTEVAVGFWRWLTEASLFNPQQTANQAIGAVVGGLTLGRHLRARSGAQDGDRIIAEAMSWYDTEIRSSRLVDRGLRLPAEHGAGHDQNYLPISLTFLARAFQVSGEQCFLDDGDEIARYLQGRLSSRGFDFGGPRYSEQHCGCEGMLGLRLFSTRIGADIGRYLGDRRVAYYCATTAGVPSGHFAFATVWFWLDDHRWHRGATDAVVHTRHSLRQGRTSVSLTDQLTPYLIDAGDTAVIESIVDHQHGIGPLVRYPDGQRVLLTRPLGPMRTRECTGDRLGAKLVTKAVVTRDQVMLAVQQLFVSDGSGLHVVTVLDRTALPADTEVTFLAGLPYATAEGARQRKIVEVVEPGGVPFDLGRPDQVLTTTGALVAGGMAVTAGSGLRVINPPAGRAHVNSPQTIGLTQEQVAFDLTDDPRGYGNPDAGWRRVALTNLVLADRIADAPADLAVFVVRYGPAADVTEARPLPCSARRTADGVLVRTRDFTALIGDPAGDAQGEPVLRVTTP
ncbi:hypothetical protein ACFFS4_04065 [Kutzneria kofuensis]|uniref:Heparinase II/III-like protein n=1 Tax=Kutzneria kofuensis TaxID=103725 RepID=A0A7W9KTV2_9PSEU|nr:hypothetical protein [Kutzneria kofuensis]MBB5897874.1 hypothetical protein [Kutzneria kofuensis]